jgi:hypothetical protein
MIWSGRVDVRHWDPTADATAAVVDALTHAAEQGGGTVVLPAGVLRFSGPIHVPGTVNLVGQGGAYRTFDGQHGGPSILLATHADAQLIFDGQSSAGWSGNFVIDGAHIGGAAGLMIVDYKVGGHYEGISLRASAGDGLVVQRGQNCVYQSIDTSHHAGHGLVVERGAGGTLFSRVEANANGGWGVIIRDPLGDGPYDKPQHNRFQHCILERENLATGQTQGALSVRNATNTIFDSCIFAVNASTISGAVVDVDAAAVSFTGCSFYSASQNVGLRWGATATIHLSGRNLFLASTAIEHNGGWGTVESPEFGSSVVTRWGGTGTPGNLGRVTNGPAIHTLDPGKHPYAFRLFQRGQEGTGYRFQINADGQLRWMDGTSFTADTNLYRGGADNLRTDDDFEVASGARGVILRSPNGSRFRVRVDDCGHLVLDTL